VPPPGRPEFSTLTRQSHPPFSARSSATHRPGTTVVRRWAGPLCVEASREEEVELFSHLGEGSDEGSPTSIRYSAGKRLSKPVRLLSEAANVDEAHAFELGTLLQATKHRHNLPLQLRGWEGHPRRQLYSFSSGHRVANDGSGNLVPQPSNRETRMPPATKAADITGEIHRWSDLKASELRHWSAAHRSSRKNEPNLTLGRTAVKIQPQDQTYRSRPKLHR